MPPLSARTSSAIPRTVWMLVIVSMLMDVSSEMIQTMLPVYMVSTLGLSAIWIGVIEGASVTIAMTTRLFSGVLSDIFQRRKTLTLIGYGLGALSKPFFPLADAALTLVGAKFLDRVGKGIRSAPRDAMIADVAPPGLQGASFGLRKSLDTVGGFLGPLVAIGIMLASGGDIQLLFWIAVVPAFLAIVVLAVGVKEPARVNAATGRQEKKTLTFRDAVRLSPAVWSVIVLAVLMSGARFSEAFLLLRAQQSGWSLAWLPLVVVAMHLIYGLVAYPAGKLFDRLGARGVLAAGMLCLAAADLALGLADGVPLLIVGIVLWGLHMGLSQGVLAALVSSAAPAHLRATAFGVLHLATGLAVLAGNVLAGVLWETAGPAYTFYVGAGLSLAALAVVLFMLRARPAAAA
ncbi:MAG: MFS transporter [Achromobacter sp.]